MVAIDFLPRLILSKNSAIFWIGSGTKQEYDGLPNQSCLGSLSLPDFTRKPAATFPKTILLHLEVAGLNGLCRFDRMKCLPGPGRRDPAAADQGAIGLIARLANLPHRL
jgi:hypothetical protein